MFKHLVILSMFDTKLLLASSVVFTSWSLAIASPSLAFSIDFQKAPDITLGGTAVADVYDLDAYDIDSAGGQTINYSNGTSSTFSTTTNNVGSIWNPLGVNITHSGNLGLFQSNCKPNGGNGSATSGGTNYTDLCNINNNDGDPDLATGYGNYGTSPNDESYATNPRGNLLILEESTGDSIPDDKGGNGNLIEVAFDNGVLDDVELESVTIVDDASGHITVTFRDASTETILFDNSVTSGSIYDNITNTTEYVAGENAVAVYGGFTQGKDVEKFRISFDGSGGFGAFAFSEFSGETVEVPFEFSPSLGLIFSLGMFGKYWYETKVKR